MNTIKSITVLKHKQRGATLFTSLVFLALMTIVGVSAAKIATLDTIVAGNNQQIMLVFQQTDKTLVEFTNPVEVIRADLENKNSPNSHTHIWNKTLVPDADGSTSNHAIRNIASRDTLYPCKANGKANSIGNGTANCRIYDLSAQDQLENNGITDRHFRGVEKRVPDTSNYQ